MIFVATLLLASAATAQLPTIVEPTARAADSILTTAVERGFNGVVLVRKGGQPILRKAYGVAQRETNTPFLTNTVVQIGSNTKDFTRVAIHQLAYRGRLRVTDSLARFFPDAPADKRAITVRQLLNHRSGLPHMIAPDSMLITRDDFLGRVMRVQLAFTPGSQELYSNPGYSVLAAIIEQQTGVSYDQYVRDSIFAKLGMRETGYVGLPFDSRRLAHGYAAGVDKHSVLDLPHPSDGASWTLRGNGGMVSTVDDMATFYQALFETEKLLPRAARDRAFDVGAVVLAGSDRVSVFVYRREPAMGIEALIASTTTEMPAFEVMRPIMGTLGFNAGRPQIVVDDARPVALPATPAGSAVRDYLDMYHRADSAAAVRYFATRFVPSPDVPPEQRVVRLRSMRENLRDLVPVRYNANGSQVEVSVSSSAGEVVVMLFDIEPEAPYRIRSLRVRVGD